MKTKKITVSIFQILIFVLIVCIISIIAIVVVMNQKKETTVDEKLGEKSEIFNGMGTVNEPYEIKNVEDLIKLSESVNNGKDYAGLIFKLEDNIDFSGVQNFLPIGNNPNGSEGKATFAGTFDGNAKSITGITKNVSQDSENKNFALFGDNTGTIKNLRITAQIDIEKAISDEIKVAGLTLNNSGSIENCKVEGEITASLDSYENNSEVSGITIQNTGNIIDSSSLVNITSNLKKAGICIENEGVITNTTNSGIVKEEVASTNYTVGNVYENKGTMTNCNNTGLIQGYLAVGVVGKSSGTLISCQNTGEISNIYDESNTIEAESVCAGVIIELDSNATLENSRNSGEIVGNEQIAGICIINNGKITNCINEAKISKKENSTEKNIDISGICAINKEGSLQNCKNIADIFAINVGKQKIKLGTVCASVYASSIIENCENTGNIQTEGKDVNVSEDNILNVTNCVNSGTGAIAPVSQGNIFVGMIYGKLEEE